MRTDEEICVLLNEKFKSEAKRLESWGTKHSYHSSASFVIVVKDFVRALMAESRSREARRILKKVRHIPASDAGMNRLIEYVEERIKATERMAQAIEWYAVAQEGKRPWNPKKKKHRRHRR